jgi:ribonucleoside-diphosphate reductase alpha chain
VRARLPETRRSVTHRAVIESQQGPLTLFVTAGLYQDGRVGEVFVQAGKLGSTVRGLLDDWARAVSYLLQYGVPVAEVVERFRGGSYPPAGLTANAELPACSSLTDYVMRWLETVGGGRV